MKKFSILLQVVCDDSESKSDLPDAMFKTIKLDGIDHNSTRDAWKEVVKFFDKVFKKIHESNDVE